MIIGGGQVLHRMIMLAKSIISMTFDHIYLEELKYYLLNFTVDV